MRFSSQVIALRSTALLDGGFRTPYPFHRTIEQIGERGLVKTTSAIMSISLISLKDFLVHLRYVPESTVVEINRSKMLLFPRKGAIHYDLWAYKKREPICTDYLMNSGIVKEGDVVLDIGANIGYYALIESQLVGNHGRVYASEPVLDNFELLRANVKINHLENVQTFPFAFGEREGKSRIYVSQSANLCAFDRNAVGGKIVGVQEVPMTTTDTFLENRGFPDLIRMDVEGYEYEIIKGMLKTLKRNVKILVELHPPFLSQKLNEILRILVQNNFKVRFAVFEHKAAESKLVSDLMKKAGDDLPVVASHLSVQELDNLIDRNPGECPNVVFEK